MEYQIMVYTFATVIGDIVYSFLSAYGAMLIIIFLRKAITARNFIGLKFIAYKYELDYMEENYWKTITILFILIFAINTSIKFLK